MIVSLLVLADIACSPELVLGKTHWLLFLVNNSLFTWLPQVGNCCGVMGDYGWWWWWWSTCCLIRPGQLSWSVWFGSLLELVVAGKVPTFQWSGGLPAACADFSLRAAWQQVRRFLRIKLTAVLAHSLPNNPLLSRLFPFNNQLSIIRERLERRTSTVGCISS